MESTASLAAQHVLSHFHRVPRTQPMFVALQGPQGSGKTYLTRSLVSSLSSPPHSLRVATLSVDDLYLNHLGLHTLASENPGNPLWRGRGQPGTHDVKLGADILRRLREVNVEDGIAESQIVLPIFDKSKHNGEGDRAHAGTLVNLPIDVFILEGWCVGFYPLEQPELDEMWENVCSMSETIPGSIIQRAMEAIRKEDIEAVNHALCDYVKEWYGFFEVFVQVSSNFIRSILVCLFEGCNSATQCKDSIANTHSV